MSDDLTNKEIRAAVQRYSQPCPCCGSALMLSVTDKESPLVQALYDAGLAVASRSGLLVISPAEEVEQIIQTERDGGHLADIAGVREDLKQ